MIDQSVSVSVDFSESNPKSQVEFRNYLDSNRQDIVSKTYNTMHKNQCVDFVKKQYSNWGKFNHHEATILECLSLLDQVVDDSDPDVDIPNSIHAYQTAERIRKDYPNQDWFHLVGLIHDLGKVLAMWGEPQWAVVGDTFPVGCQFSQRCVFPESFKENPDNSNHKYNSKFGIYEENCGLDNVMMSWGHDEYCYQVLKNSPECKLPQNGLDMIRYHSFYPWHTAQDYMYLCNDKDLNETLPWVLKFNIYDLYSKADDLPDVDALRPYYEGLIEKYIPGKLRW